jgi:hypothetical protein
LSSKLKVGYSDIIKQIINGEDENEKEEKIMK